MKIILNFVFSLILCSSAFSVVSTNPFLRPGSEKKPTSPTPIVPKKQLLKVDASKEIEFRGYFILKGQPFFCIFNKKSGHGEWVTLTESTYESFLVQEFDMKTETLTVVYADHSYDLSLLDAISSSSSSPSPSPSPSKSINTTKFMPPKPKTTPSLPAWLVNQRSSRSVDSYVEQREIGPGNNSSYPGYVPRRVIQRPFFPGSANLPGAGPISQPLLNPVNPTPRKANTNGSVGGTDNMQGNNLIPMDGNEIIDDSPNQDQGLDLQNLPPPPPPPNILPPSPPPDILPSRDE